MMIVGHLGERYVAGAGMGIMFTNMAGNMLIKVSRPSTFRFNQENLTQCLHRRVLLVSELSSRKRMAPETTNALGMCYSAPCSFICW